jgi:hypothetical protein
MRRRDRDDPDGALIAGYDAVMGARVLWAVVLIGGCWGTVEVAVRAVDPDVGSTRITPCVAITSR